MSIRAMLWVLDELNELPAGPTLVMVALADYADEDGTCWPSQERIAARARASERSVRRHLTWLQEQGLVTVEHRWAQRGAGRSTRVSSVYRLPVGKAWTPDEAPKKTAGRRVSAGQPVPDNLTGKNEDGRVSAGQVVPDNLAGTGSYRTNGAVIPDTGVRYIEEPPEEPPSLPSIPTGGSADGRPGREGAAGAASDGADRSDPESPTLDAGASIGGGESSAGVDDWALVRSVLPEQMQALPGGDVARVATALRERLAAGWSEKRIRETLAARALPATVRTLGGLVMARLRDDVPVEAAPRGGRAGGSAGAGCWQVVLPGGRAVTASDLDLGALAIAHNAAKAQGDPRAVAGRFAYAEAVGVEQFLVDPVGRRPSRRGA